jgi:Uma2 family endonuclease
MVVPMDHLLTAEEFEKFENPDPRNDWRYELVRGRVIRMAPPAFTHGSYALGLGTAIDQHVEANALGKAVVDAHFTIERGPDTCLVPDIAFVSTARLPEDPDRFYEGAADLAIEIKSPSDRERDVLEKVEHYLRTGTREVWVVRPKPRTLTIYQAGQESIVLTERDTVEGREVLPGFRYALKQLFDRV